MQEYPIIDKIIKSRIPGRCVLILSDGNCVFALIDSVLEKNLNKGNALEPESLEFLQNALKLNKLKGYAFRLCEGFSRSEFQIISKLKEKNYTKENIDPTISHLKEIGLINDQKFAENFVNYSLRKRWGLKKIIRELEIRKVSKADYSDLINTLDDKTEFIESAMNLGAKKLRMIAGKPVQKQKEALMRHLITKGYDYDIIKEVTRKLIITSNSN